MRKNESIRLLILVALLLGGCSATRMDSTVDPAAPEPPDRTITVTFLQLNDVYEITPVEGGKRGGLARVATLRKQLTAENPHTYTLIAGDFFSPSALGTARVDGERLAGRQMVAALNAMGLDFATFGNHEFDVKRDQFYQRLQESDFTYVSGNVFDEQGRPFPGVKEQAILKVPGLPGDTLRIGLLGVTLASNPQDYVRYTEPFEAMLRQARALDDETDALVALTHLTLKEDIALADAVPALDLIMGGHEHENIQVLRGPNLSAITKADANARTVYVHTLAYDPASGAVETASRIRQVDDRIPEDPETAAVVEHWVERAFEGFRQQGLRPAQPVVTLPEGLDGREGSVRNRPTELTALIAEAMVHAVPEAELAVYNSGSIRIDDVLTPGTLIEYDVIRVLPFGGQVLAVDIQGSLLDSTLTQGALNRGSGGYLQHTGVSRDDDGRWRIQGRPLDPDRRYRMAVSDFLVTGLEQNLGYLNFDNPGLTQVAEHGDVRLAVIEELKRRYGE